jgi:hypothetical protein
MMLIIYYVVIMLILNVATILIGFAVENLFGAVASMIVFLSLYFAALWAAWVASVWLTKPKALPAAIPVAVVAKPAS